MLYSFFFLSAGWNTCVIDGNGIIILDLLNTWPVFKMVKQQYRKSLDPCQLTNHFGNLRQTMFKLPFI